MVTKPHIQAPQALPGIMKYYAITGVLVLLFAGGLSFAVLAVSRL